MDAILDGKFFPEMDEQNCVIQTNYFGATQQQEQAQDMGPIDPIDSFTQVLYKNKKS